MDSGSPTNSPQLPAGASGNSPRRWHLLYVAGPRGIGRWLVDAMVTDRTIDITVVEAAGSVAAAKHLRDESFDALLIGHETTQLPAPDFLSALRTSGNDTQPLIVLGEESEAQLGVACYAAGADAYVCLVTATARGLLWQLSRAVEHHALRSENRRLRHEQRHACNSNTTKPPACCNSNAR